MPEKDDSAAQLEKAEVVLGVSLVAGDQAPEVLKPSPQSFDLPAAPVSAKLPSILGRRSHPIFPVRRDEFDAVILLHLRVQRVAIIGQVPDQTPRLLLHEATLDSPVDQLHFVRRSRFNANGDRKTMSVSDRHDFCTLSPLCFPNKRAPFLAGAKLPSTKHSSKSIPPRSFKSLARALTTLSNTPFFTHSWKRRWQVDLGGYLLGNSSHCAPVRSIHSTAFITSRGSRHGRPFPSSRTRGFGIIGPMISHCLSLKSIGSPQLADVTSNIEPENAPN